MVWRQYVLEANWAFDHSNTEYATLTDEGGFDLDRLFDPGTPEHEKSLMMQTINRICSTQNGNPMTEHCKPVALYLVVGPHRPFAETGLPYASESAGTKHLYFVLKLVGRFDDSGKPVLNTASEAASAV